MTAFLNRELEEEVLVCPPNGIYPRKGELVTLHPRKGKSEEASENKENRIMKLENRKGKSEETSENKEDRMMKLEKVEILENKEDRIMKQDNKVQELV